MSSKPQPSSAKNVSTSRTFQQQKAKPGGRILTSEAILADIAEFKKRDGRIDVLGNTAFRTGSTSTAFTSRSTAALKKPPTPVAETNKSAR